MEIEEKYNFELRTGDLDDVPWSGSSMVLAWKLAVRRGLQLIECSDVGRLLLRSIRSHGFFVKILPYWWIGAHSGKNTSCNPLTTPLDSIEGGKLFRAQMHISPERYGKGSACAEHHRGRGGAVADDHEILFHELVHAFRFVSRPDKNTFLGGDRLGGGLIAQTNREEFIAVLVTNIYASANGKTRLRAGHRGHHALADELEGSFKFFQLGSQAFALVDSFCNSNPGFCKALGRMKVPFNPIRAMQTDREKARRMSEGQRAAIRDARGDMLAGWESMGFYFDDLEALMK